MDKLLNNDIEKVKKALQSNIDEDLESFDYFHIGELIEVPNQCGCFKRNSGWYIYETDEKNYCTFTGPFCMKAVIRACACILHIKLKTEKYSFSEEELSVFLHNNFHSIAEIDEYIKGKKYDK